MSLPALTRVLLLVATVGILLGGCATRTASSPEASGAVERWVVLGDRDAGPGAAGLLAALPATAGRPEIVDVSTAAATLRTIVEQQMLQLGGTRADLFIVQLGGEDARAVSPPEPGVYGALVASLVVTLRERGETLVGTIPTTASDRNRAEGSIEDVRRLRRVLEYNEAIRTTVWARGAAVVEQEQPWLTGEEAMEAARGAWRSAASGAGRGLPAGAPAAAVRGFEGAAAVSALRERAVRAAAAGQHPDVVAKVGDSITASPAFLMQLTAADIRRTGHPALADTLDFFSRSLVPVGEDPTEAGEAAEPAPPVGGGPAARSVTFSAALASPLARHSLAAGDGWGVAEALADGADGPLARELATLRPGVALVMFGTNDLTRTSVERFEELLDRLVAAIEAQGVIPVLSTIPARIDQPAFAERAPRFNAAVRAVAAAHGVPLIDFAAASASLPNHGLAADGIHPSTCPDEGPSSFSARCLRYGSNLRNLVTLQALEQLRTRVFGAEDGALTEAGGRR